jgi:hypothetical protein
VLFKPGVLVSPYESLTIAYIPGMVRVLDPVLYQHGQVIVPKVIFETFPIH